MSAYTLAKYFAQFITSTFFRDIEVVGLENILEGVPLIIYGNHANQFLDPLMIISYAKRQVKFVGAAHSLKRPIIGHVGRMMGAIPVIRPQDIGKKAQGKITDIEQGKIRGTNTLFTSEVKIGDTILVDKFEFLITKVVSDTECEFKPQALEVKIDANFKVIPKVDQSEMFNSVWEALKNDDCVGIFPEGGSHDQIGLLPLKAGICIMALGAMQKFGKMVYLQPVCMNYFKRHQFRSKVIIEFGQARLVPQSMLELYNNNKREAISTLLKEVELQLGGLSFSSNSFSKLSEIHITRSIYLPNNKVISPEDRHMLLRRFQKGMSLFQDHPEVMALQYRIKLYSKKLRYLGINDYQIRTIVHKPFKDLMLFLYSVLMIIFNLIFSLPGLVMNLPIALALQYLSEKERKKALAGSKVKIHGIDVIATYKILSALVIFPISIVIYTILFYSFIHQYLPEQALTLSTVFFFLWPIYVMILIRSFSGLSRHAKTVRGKILFYTSHTTFVKLQIKRKELQLKIRKTVALLAEQMIPMFKDNEIVKDEDYNENENIRDSSDLLDSYY